MQRRDDLANENNYNKPARAASNRFLGLDFNFLRCKRSGQKEQQNEQVEQGLLKAIESAEIFQDIDAATGENSTPQIPDDIFVLEDPIPELRKIDIETPPEHIHTGVLAKLIDTKTGEQLQTAYQARLQELETIAECDRPTAAQIEQLDTLIAQMRQDLTQMRHAMSKAFATQRRIEQQYNQAQTVANNWEPRVQTALKNGDENRAREAMLRQKAYTDMAATFRDSLDWQAPLIDSLKSNLIDWENKIAAAKTKKDLLIALINARDVEALEQGFQARLQELEMLANCEKFTNEPIERLPSLIVEMQEYLAKIRHETTKAIAMQKNTEKQYNLAISAANNWQRRAQMTLQKGDQHRNKEFAARYQVDIDSAASLKIVLDVQTAQVDILKRDLITLEIKISEAKTKKDLLKVQASVTKANEQLQNTLGRWVNNPPTEAIAPETPEILPPSSIDRHKR